MDVLHHDLKAVEASCLGDLDFTAETLDKIFVDNAITRREERKDMGDKVAFIVVETVVPIVEILGQVDFFGSPEGSFSFLVHLPNLPLVIIQKGQ